MSELRQDPFGRYWVVIAEEHGRRASDFESQVEATEAAACPFCAFYGAEGGGEHRIAERPAPDGPVLVVANGLPALQVEERLERRAEGPYSTVSGVGANEVIVDGPDCDADIATHPTARLVAIIQTWRDRVADLQRDTRLRSLSVFRSRGRCAGSRLRHPHAQLVALPVIQPRLATELAVALEHYRRHERCLFSDLVGHELADRRRLVRVDDRFVSCCPYAARVPFETVILPRTHAPDFGALSDEDAAVLARHLQDVMGRLALSLGEFSYNLTVSTGPNLAAELGPIGRRDEIRHAWRWRIEIVPRSTWFAGFEWASGMYLNPTAPEDAAAHLRAVATSGS